MTLEKPTLAAARELDRYRRRAAANDARWPKECLESERRFGHRAARLYPLISHERRASLGGGITNENAVRTPKGIGTLLQVLGGEARVLLMRTKSVLMYRQRSSDKHGRPMTSFPVEEIEPYVSGNSAGRKGAR